MSKWALILYAYIFNTLSTDPQWSVLFVINQINNSSIIFQNALEKINSLKIDSNYQVTVKILTQESEIDDLYLYLNRTANHHALIIWDHREDIYHPIFNKQKLQDISSQIKFYLNKKLDILCLDSCCSVCFEYAYSLRNNIDYLIGCQDYHFLDGFCYDFLSQASLFPEDLCEFIITSSNNYYLYQDNYNLINFSTINCNKSYLLLPFIKRLKKLSHKNRKDLFLYLATKFKQKSLINSLKEEIVIHRAAGSYYAQNSGLSIYL